MPASHSNSKRLGEGEFQGGARVDDRELVQGLLGNENEAVAVFLERYRALFQHCIAHFETDPIAREDLFQELVWHAIERLRQPSFDPEKGSFGTWLYRVAWCHCVDQKRKENARRRVLIKSADAELPNEPDPSPGPREQAGDEEIGSLVRASLGELEGEERRLLVLRFVDGKTLVEVAGELGLSLEQTKYRLKRASSALRKSLLSRLPRAEAVE